MCFTGNTNVSFVNTNMSFQGNTNMSFKIQICHLV